MTKKKKKKKKKEKQTIFNIYEQNKIVFFLYIYIYFNI